MDDVEAAARKPQNRPARAPSGPRARAKQSRPGSPSPAPRADAAVQTSPKSPPATFVAPPPLTPPPHLSFETAPIPWKGLPLEVAQWTFSSTELQEIVSKAIRLSARESFVRLLSIQALEVDVVQEHDRLDAERAAAQAKWRFEAGRRTMLMQALNAAAANAPAAADDPVLGFVGQLAASIAACDALLASVLGLSDQCAQIEIIQHQHWASALGIALRKLNRAHERQALELKRLQTRVQTLEDELEEAWREAEKMAFEFDDLERDVLPSEPDIDPVMSVLPPPPEVDDTTTLGDMTINTDIAVVLGVTATAVATRATLLSSASSPKHSPERSDAKSIRSVKSTRSRRSISHASRISAARLRSRAASSASLRLPKSLRSPSLPQSPDDPPPLPTLTVPTNGQGQSFLDLEAITPVDTRKALPPKRLEPTIALPTPPHSAGLPPTQLPSAWLDPDEEEDSDNSARRSGLDRPRSMQMLASLMKTPRMARRTDLLQSLTVSTGVDEEGTPTTPSSPRTAVDLETLRPATDPATTRPTTPARTSPVSSPTHARGPSLVSSMGSIDIGGGASLGVGSGGSDVHGFGGSDGVVEMARSQPVEVDRRPGSADARLTTRAAGAGASGSMMPVAPTPIGKNGSTPTLKLVGTNGAKRSLVRRAGSVLLRRFSQAATMAHREKRSRKPSTSASSTTGSATGTSVSIGVGVGVGLGPGLVTGLGSSVTSSPSKSHEALRSSGSVTGRERWKGSDLEEAAEEEEARAGQGEVMLIGSVRSSEDV